MAAPGTNRAIPSAAATAPVTAEWSSAIGPPARPRIGRVRWWRSLRSTTALLIGALLCVVVLGSGIAALHILRTSAVQQLRLTAISELGRAITTPQDQSLPTNATNRVGDIPVALVRAVRRLDTSVTYDDGGAMWAATASSAGSANDDGIVAVRLSNGDVDRVIHDAAVSLATAGLAAAISGCAATWLILSVSTGRLRRLTEAVRTTGGRERAVRVAGRDEIAALSEVITDAAERMHDMLERERGFAAEVAHELRTPLTALSTSAQLLEDDATSARIRRQIDRLQRSTEDLIELGRAGAGIPGPTVALEQVVRERVSEHRQDGADIELEGTSDATVDQRRWTVMVDNLIRNARRHGEAPIHVRIDADAVTISDHGSGYPAHLLANGPRRFTDSGQRSGTGLGLAIVREHAEHEGALLLLANLRDGGARSTLRLQERPRREPGEDRRGDHRPSDR